MMTIQKNCLCLECNNTGLAQPSGRACGFCDNFKLKFEICPNCDDTAIIPPGMTSDDCILCEGRCILPRTPEVSISDESATGNVEWGRASKLELD